MATVILSAARPARPSLQALATLLVAELERRGEREIKSFELATTKLAHCQGEFDCWVKTPGICRAHDAEQAIVQAIHDAERLVLLDEITFGGHSFTVKRAQDRLICLLSPFFEKRATLTHHGYRYDHAPSLYALGWMPTADAEQAQTWRALAEANAINLLAPRIGTAVVDDGQPDGWAAAIAEMLASLTVPGDQLDSRGLLREALRQAARPAPWRAPPQASSAGAAPAPPPRPRTAALLVGSAKPKGTSASENLARALAARLKRAGLPAELRFATDFVHEGAAAHAAAQAIAAADLFVLVSPLYVDALPALATHALQLVAAARTAQPAPPAPAQFAALLNCGFPEPEHHRTALRIAHHFAEQASYRWAGGLPLGGGGILGPGRPLDERHGPVEHIKRALDAAAPALAAGDGVPAQALDLMLQAPIADVLYRVLGDLGWRYQAYKNGLAQRALRARPLE